MPCYWISEHDLQIPESRQILIDVFIVLSLLSTKSNLSLHSLYYAEACNELAGRISASLHLRTTKLHSKKFRSSGQPLATLHPIWSAKDLNLRPLVPKKNALPLDQLTGYRYCEMLNFFLNFMEAFWLFIPSSFSFFEVNARIELV